MLKYTYKRKTLNTINLYESHALSLCKNFTFISQIPTVEKNKQTRIPLHTHTKHSVCSQRNTYHTQYFIDLIIFHLDSRQQSLCHLHIQHSHSHHQNVNCGRSVGWLVDWFMSAIPLIIANKLLISQYVKYLFVSTG